MSEAPAPIVRDAPPESGWNAFERTANAEALDTRSALGLPTDRPIVMTGHHAEWWHAGLVAKYIGAQHLAEEHNAAWSCTLVDHKSVRPNVIEAPCLDDDGVLVARNIDLAQDEDSNVYADSGYGQRVRTLRDQWNSSTYASPVARWQDAMRESLRPQVDLADPLHASTILTTPAAHAIIERMRDDPWSCALAYNRAVVRTPQAGLTPLHVGVDPGAVELPLWHTTDEGGLGRVFAGDMEHIDSARLAPRALLLTGLTRLLLCDLFIHGVGGYVYDRATELWLREWLGVELAPMGAITADALLSLETLRVDEEEARRLRQYAHRARHQPVLVGDTDAQRRKLELVRTIRALPRHSRERREAYAQMHRELDEVRMRHAVELQAFEGEAMRAARLVGASELANRRTWAFALFDDDARDALRAGVVRAISPA